MRSPHPGAGGGVLQGIIGWFRAGYCNAAPRHGHCPAIALLGPDDYHLSAAARTLADGTPLRRS